MGFLDSITKALSSPSATGIASQAARSMGASRGTAGLVGMVSQVVQTQMQEKQQEQGAVAGTTSVTPSAAPASDPFAPPPITDGSARAFNRIALLNVAGWRDGNFSAPERVVLYRAIRDSHDLDANMRLDLMREVDKQPAEIQDFWGKAKANLSFDGLFADQAEAQTFVQTLQQLVQADGNLDPQELAFVQMVQQACGIS